MEIRLIAEGEEELCNDFHNRAYNEKRTIQQWTWGFVQNNFKQKPIPYAVVVDQGKIVGTQAFIPIRMIDNDGIYWTAKSEGTLLDPEYRGKRLFQGMYELLFDYAKKHEFAYIWGFTAAVKALIPLDFEFPCKTEQMFFPFSSKSVVPMMNKNAFGGKKGSKDKIKIALFRAGCILAQAISSLKLSLHKKSKINELEIRTWDKPDEQAGELCKNFIKKWGGTTIYRDAEYLQWRLFDNQYVKSVVRAIYYKDKLLGWAAFTLGDEGMGYLVDLMVANDDSPYSIEDLIRILLLEAVTGTRNMGATGIRGWRINNHPFDRLIYKAAKKIGFYHIRRGYSVVLYNCEASKGRVSYNNFDDWFVSRIFSEGVVG